MNRVKNGIIFIILIVFLCLVAMMPVTCIFKTVTGISCPACGMTRAFLALFHFHFFTSVAYNLLGIPLFIFLITSIIILIKEFFQNSFSYVPRVLIFFEKHYVLLLILLFISFAYNNLKPLLHFMI